MNETYWVRVRVLVTLVRTHVAKLVATAQVALLASLDFEATLPQCMMAIDGGAKSHSEMIASTDDRSRGNRIRWS